MIDFLSMRCFVAAAEELHFGRAAQRLNISQPALSQHVGRLEKHVGVPLLLRSTRRVELTPSGRVFLEHCRDMFAKTDEAVLNARIAGGKLGSGGERLIVGAITPATDRLLPLILERFRRKFPGTRLEIAEADSTLLLRGLEQGDFHVGLMRRAVNSNLVRFRPLVSERFVAVMPRQSKLAGKTSLRLSDFVGQSVFALKRFELLSFEQLCGQLMDAGLLTRSDVLVSDTKAALALVAAGVGTTFLPEWVSSIVTPGVVTRFVDDLSVEIPMVIGWKADCPVPGILPFIDCAVIASARLMSERRGEASLGGRAPGMSR